MKKLSPRFEHWLAHRQKSASRVHATRILKKRNGKVGPLVVDAWDGVEEIKVRVIKKPISPEPRLCFDTNYRRTANFLGVWQRRVFNGAWTCKRRGAWISRPIDGSRPTLTSFYDFSIIEEVSTAASVVIAAEYERAKLIVGAPPPAVNLDRWTPSAFSKLYGMGFFEAVGLSRAEAARFTDRDGNFTMQILSGDTGDQLPEAGKAFESLLAEALQPEQPAGNEELEALIFWINTAVSEALTNVSHWAYEDCARRGPRRWWVAATLSPLTNNLTVVVYDQGVTIPKSLTKKSWLEDLVTKVRAAWVEEDTGPVWSDSQWVAAALEYRRSRSRQEFRGKGLPQMVAILDHCPAGSLRIVSGAGSCYLEKGAKMIQEAPLRNPIMGTLLEWKLQLPVQS